MHWNPFVKSKEIISLIGLANNYNCRPSSLLGITDVYTAFCFDEACSYIKDKLSKQESPVFTKHYDSFSQIYEGLEY